MYHVSRCLHKYIIIKPQEYLQNITINNNLAKITKYHTMLITIIIPESFHVDDFLGGPKAVWSAKKWAESFAFQLCVSFWSHSFWSYWEGWNPVNRFNHTSWVAVVSPTDRHNLAHNRCVIEVFGSVFVLSLCFWSFLWV